MGLFDDRGIPFTNGPVYSYKLPKKSNKKGGEVMKEVEIKNINLRIVREKYL